MWRWFLVGLVLGITLVAGGGWLSFRWWQSTDRVAFCVRVQGVDIGGLKSTEAIQVLSRAFPEDSFAGIVVPIICEGQIVRKVKLRELKVKPDERQAVKIALEIGRRQSLLESLREFVMAWQGGINLPMSWEWDRKSAEGLLMQLAQTINRPPQRAQVEFDGKSIRIVPSLDGICVEVDETLRVWQERLSEGQWENLPLITKVIRPEVTTEDVAGIDRVVGQATTHFRTSERNRAYNIRLAASRLDHVLVRPGETISFNELVGPRTPKRGFRMARVLVRGEFTQDFGGGVCQVAGTLYLAALRAGMEVVCRHRHSRPVGYLPPGLDATVNFGSLDLKLCNSFPTPLYLRTFVRGSRLTVIVLGKRQPNRTYRIVRYTERISKSREEQVPDQSLPIGVRKVVNKGSSGYRVEVWRLVIENGGVVVKRERISTDLYPPQPKRVRVGTRQMTISPPPPTNEQVHDNFPQQTPDATQVTQ
jgi:vancomycin resistance protein YoaR